MTFARFVPTPENRSALLAVQDVAAHVGAQGCRRASNPLYVHGPPGSGKTHLVTALIHEAARQTPPVILTLLQANDLVSMTTGEPREAADDTLLAAKHSDLLVVEDLHQLRSDREPVASRMAELLVQLFDHLYARQRQLVFTALVGPRELLPLPARLLSRLACGLVVSLRALSAASRLTLLQHKAQRRQLAVSPDVLAWLAEHLSSGRQMEGALAQLALLARLHERPLDVPTVAEHFQELVQANQVTVERIAHQVGSYFRVEPRHLQSRRRYHNVLLPRQIGMYLARQMTDLSLEEIGSYFGGRDHSTVLHACRKIKNALVHDVAISGAVKQLQADLV